MSNKKHVKKVITNIDAVKATKYFAGNICVLFTLNKKITSKITSIKIGAYGKACLNIFIFFILNLLTI